MRRRRTVTPGLPGVLGAARPVRSGIGDPVQATRSLIRRLEPGDVAVVDHIDLDRVSGEALVAARPGAVINARPSLSGRHPARGAQVLVAAGIPVVDATGTGLLSQVRDGTPVRVHEGRVYDGERLLGAGTVLTPDSVHQAQAAAQNGMTGRLGSVGADAARFLDDHAALLLDGSGLPAVHTRFTGATVLIVGPGDRAAAQTVALRRWAKDTGPVLVTVDDGLTSAVRARLRPHLVLGDVPGRRPRRASGAEHLPAEVIPEYLTGVELAVLLALAGDAAVVVLTDSTVSLDELLDQDRSAAAARLAVRLRAGDRVVDAPAVLTLTRPAVSWWLALVMLAIGLAALAVALAAVPGGHELAHRIRESLPW